jgi:hypothetical protein
MAADSRISTHRRRRFRGRPARPLWLDPVIAGPVERCSPSVAADHRLTYGLPVGSIEPFKRPGPAASPPRNPRPHQVHDLPCGPAAALRCMPFTSPRWKDGLASPPRPLGGDSRWPHPPVPIRNWLGAIQPEYGRGHPVVYRVRCFDGISMTLPLAGDLTGISIFIDSMMTPDARSRTRRRNGPQ